MTRAAIALRFAACIVAAIALAVSRVAQAADAASPAEKPAASKPAADSLDDQLLRGLDNSLDNKLLGDDDKPAGKPTAKPAVNPAKPAANPPDQKPPAARPADQAVPAKEKPLKKPSPLLDPLDEELENSLSAGEDIGSPGEDSKNPLARIVVHMREVQQRLAQSKSDGLTQHEQQRISDELKSLVDQLAEQQQQQQSQADPSASQQSSRGKPKPGNAQAGKAPPGDPNKEPSRDSSNKVRPNHTDRPDPAVAREALAKELDRLHLPAKDREEMLQGAPDEFLPGHETSIEEYFKRLVEQEDAKP